MATAAEAWYVRLPDGRTVRVRSVDALRRSLHNGRIPRHSQVRRSRADEWRPLARVAEFADVLPGDDPSAVAADRAPATAGVRGVIEELLSAADSSLNRAKLTVAAATGVLLAAGWIALDLMAAVPLEPWGLVGYLGTAIFLVACTAVGTVLLTQMTFIELDRRRSARAVEVRQGLLRHTLRVMLGQGLVTAILVGVVLFFRAAVPWLAALDLGDLNAARAILIGLLAVIRLLVEVVCWPILGLAVLLLGPLLVIEESTIAQGLREWHGLVRRHFARIYLHEALALGLAIVVALPMLLLVGLAALSVGEAMGLVERITLYVLAGLALTPVITYLPVVNVFIYLNLRYAFSYSPRAR